MVVNALAKTCKWMLYLLAALLILIALLVASVRLAVFYSEDYSDQVASVVSSYVGSPVEIGEIDLVWNRFDASASLKDVQIRSSDGKETVVELPRIELLLDVRDILLQRTLSVRSVQLSNLSLAARYEGPGKIRMLGASLSPDELDRSESKKGRGSSALSWLFNAKRISILDSDITLIDAMMDRDYEIDDVNINVFNEGDSHQIRISSALPGEIGEKSLASFDFTGKADNIDEWQGKFYVNAEGLDIDQLSGFLSESSHQFNGHAGVQAWGSFLGTRINSVRVIGNCESLQLQQPSSDNVTIASLDARDVNIDLDWQRLESGWQLSFSRFSAVLDNKEVQLNGLDIQLSNEDGSAKYIAATGPDIDLQSFVPAHNYIDALLPEDAPVRAHSLQQGLLKDWRVSGIVSDEKNILTELQVTAVDLAVGSFDEAPGISDLTTAVVFQDGAGIMTFDNQDITLALPALYENPLPVINVDGDIRFILNADLPTENELTEGAVTVPGVSVKPTVLWNVVSEDLRLSSLDLNTSATFSFTGLSDGSRLIDSHTAILNANLAGIQEFYPARIIPPKTLNYMKVALVGGDITSGRVELKGDLNDFAPYEGRGHFYSEIDIANTTVKFDTEWPALENVDGNLSFSAAAMRGRLYQGSIREATFSDARLHVPDIKAPVMAIKTSLTGPVSDMLDFAQTGPMANLIGRAFGNSTGSGTSRLNLDLQVPMKKELKDQRSIDGSVALNNARINSKTFGVDLESVSGDVRFNPSGIITDSLQASYQGRSLSIKAIQEVVEPGKKINRIRIGGPMVAARVLQSYKIPLVEQFDGVSNWNLDIDVTKTTGVKKRRIELTATSDLSGTAIKFPVPLNKKADELLEGKIYRDFGAPEKDWWIEIPGLVKIRSRVADGGGLESMAIAMGNSNNSVLPRRGISLSGNSHRLDAHGWVKWALDFQSRRKSSKNAEPFPFFAKVNARQMTIGDQVFNDLAYTSYRDGSRQIHRFENSLISGEMVLGQRPWLLRLDRLDRRLLLAIGNAEIASRASTDSTGVTDRSYDPRDVPALDINVTELIWDNWRFSRVALRTEPTERGMRISAVTARQNTMRVSGSGFWEQSQSRGVSAHVTKLDLTASFDDFGRAISDIADVESFAAGTGEAALSILWPKPAYSPDLQTMRGQLLFNLRNGRILSVQPGASRILGLIALQSLPRRLAGDFRDITDNGLEYTGVSGNLSIANGQAQTNAIAMSGPVAEILIQGTSGFVDKTHEQTIDVLPRVSGALPILGILSGGPAAGLTALLADNILRGIGLNLDEFGRRRYMLTGSWEQPVWDDF